MEVLRTALFISTIIITVLTVISVSAIDVGDSAPNFSLMQFDGDIFTLKDHRGYWVIVNFWSTECKPCVEELPDYAIVSRSKYDSVIVAAINVDNTERKLIEEYVSVLDYKGDLIWLCDPAGRIWKKYLPRDDLSDNMFALPYTVIIDQKGTVVDILVGKRTDLVNYLCDLLVTEY